MTTNDRAQRRAEISAVAHLSEAQRRRWLELLDRLDAVELLRADLSTAGIAGELAKAKGGILGIRAEDLAHVDRLLGSTTSKIVLFGPSGAGKSTVINALLGRVLVPGGPAAATTSVVIYVRPVAAGEPERMEVEFLDRQAFQCRVDRLVDAVPGISSVKVSDLQQVRRTLEALAGRREADSHVDALGRLATLLEECLRAAKNHPDLLTDQPIRRVVELDDPGYERMRNLLVEPHGAKPDLSTRLVRSVTFHVRPRQQDDILRLGGVQIVDVPGADGSVVLHEDIAVEEMRRDDSVVLLVLGKAVARLDAKSVDQAVDLARKNYLGRLSGPARDAAAGKFFCAVNDDNLDRELLNGPKVTDAVRTAMSGLSKGYQARYRRRGNGRPYFVLRPLDALYLENDAAAEADRESGANYEGGIGFALGQLGITDKSREQALADPAIRAKLLANTEIPLLRERIGGYLRDDRANVVLDEADHLLQSCVAAAGAEVDRRLQELGIGPDTERSVADFEAKACLDHIDSRKRDLPEEIRKLTDQVTEQAGGVAASDALTEAKEMAGQIRVTCSDLVDRWVQSAADPHFGDHITSLNPRLPARDLNHELFTGYRRIGRLLARRHAAMLRERIGGVGVVAALAEEQYGLESPASGQPLVGDEVKKVLDRFEEEYCSAVAAAVVYELGRTSRISLIKRVQTRQEEADPPQSREQWASWLADQVDAVARLIFDDPALHSGLNSLFVEHWAWLQGELVELGEELINRQLEKFYRKDPAFQDVIMARIGAVLDEKRALLGFRARIAQLGRI